MDLKGTHAEKRIREIDRGAQALKKAFPGLAADFTDSWFRKAAMIVLEAARDDV
jgi:hypothetical protein